MNEGLVDTTILQNMLSGVKDSIVNYVSQILPHLIMIGCSVFVFFLGIYAIREIKKWITASMFGVSGDDERFSYDSELGSYTYDFNDYSDNESESGSEEEEVEVYDEPGIAMYNSSTGYWEYEGLIYNDLDDIRDQIWIENNPDYFE